MRKNCGTTEIEVTAGDLQALIYASEQRLQKEDELRREEGIRTWKAQMKSGILYVTALHGYMGSSHHVNRQWAILKIILTLSRELQSDFFNTGSISI